MESSNPRAVCCCQVSGVSEYSPQSSDNEVKFPPLPLMSTWPSVLFLITSKGPNSGRRGAHLCGENGLTDAVWRLKGVGRANGGKRFRVQAR